MKQTFTVRNCNVPCCNGQHLIEFINGKAIIPTKECLEIIRDWEENVKTICDGIICSKDKMCNVHKKMANLYFLSEFIRYNNTVRNYIISKILIRDNCMNSWCFKISAKKYFTEDVPLSWRLQYL